MAGGLGFRLGCPKIGVLVAIGNKFGNRLVIVTRESAKLDTRFLPELMLTVIDTLRPKGTEILKILQP
jgi:hypothetical protein